MSWPGCAVGPGVSVEERASNVAIGGSGVAPTVRAGSEGVGLCVGDTGVFDDVSPQATMSSKMPATIRPSTNLRNFIHRC